MRVMLGTPSLARQPALEYQMSVMRTSMLLSQFGHALDCSYTGGDCFVGKARNGVIQTFIETWESENPCDVLVFMDDDQAWEEQAFLRIIEDAHEFIGVCIPKKIDPECFNNMLLDQNEKGDCYVERGMLRASQVGSGFIALKRSVIEKMIKAYPSKYSPGDGGPHALHYNLFAPKVMWGDTDEMYDESVALLQKMVDDPENNKAAAQELLAKFKEEKPKIGQFWGEDLKFCHKWCALTNPETGEPERIWIDPNVNMSHIGRKTWTGNFMEYLQRHAMVTTTSNLPTVVDSIPSTLEAIRKAA